MKNIVDRVPRRWDVEEYGVDGCFGEAESGRWPPLCTVFTRNIIFDQRTIVITGVSIIPSGAHVPPAALDQMSHTVVAKLLAGG
jgi:hypothetical protein